MTIKPVSNRVLIQLHFPPEGETDIILPNKNNFSPTIETRRTKVQCIDVGSKVEVCKPGDFLLLHVDAERNMLFISKEPPTALIHDGVIVGIITDETL